MGKKGSVGKRARRTRRFIELIVDVPPIPAGVYRLLDEEGGFFTCAVDDGEEFTFLMGNATEAFYRRLNAGEAEPRLTGNNAFAWRYYEMFLGMRAAPPFDPVRPITVCIVEPAADRRWRSIIGPEGTSGGTGLQH